VNRNWVSLRRRAFSTRSRSSISMLEPYHLTTFCVRPAAPICDAAAYGILCRCLERDLPLRTVLTFVSSRGLLASAESVIWSITVKSESRRGGRPAARNTVAARLPWQKLSELTGGAARAAGTWKILVPDWHYSLYRAADARQNFLKSFQVVCSLREQIDLRDPPGRKLTLVGVHTSW
jgi:hypothetical protein